MRRNCTDWPIEARDDAKLAKANRGESDRGELSFDIRDDYYRCLETRGAAVALPAIQDTTGRIFHPRRKPTQLAALGTGRPAKGLLVFEAQSRDA